MIAQFAEVLEREGAGGRAVGAFTCYELATASGVLRAADEADVAVILLVSNASFSSRDGRLLVAGLIAAASHAPAVACVQLDHVSDLQTIESAVELGVGAVMADGSRLALEENAQFVSEAIRIARRAGAGVEAELGHIEGGEDVALATKAGALTEPDEALRFVERCHPDCLAVSIGNVHGEYAELPRLDWERLAELHARLDVPLSLHGASGLPQSDLNTAVSHGIVKVNVNAELRRRAFLELSEQVPTLTAGYRMLDLQDVLSDAAAEVGHRVLASLMGPPTNL